MLGKIFRGVRCVKLWGVSTCKVTIKNKILEERVPKKRILSISTRLFIRVYICGYFCMSLIPMDIAQ